MEKWEHFSFNKIKLFLFSSFQIVAFCDVIFELVVYSQAMSVILFIDCCIYMN